MSGARRPGPSTRVRVREVTSQGAQNHEDRLATEEPLEIRVTWPGEAGRRVSVTMRTPGHDFELAAGWLRAEGVVADAADLRTVAYCVDQQLTPEQRFNVVTAELVGQPRREPAGRYGGATAATSACGVCGTESIEDVLALGDVDRSGTWDDLAVPAEVLHTLPDRLRAGQDVFDRTGGLHAAGLFDAEGETLVVREDIGRHNAVDKVVGARLLSGADPAVPVLCVSGRIGFEVVQKAVAAGVGLIAAVGAPSSLAVELAERAGLCTVGFLRNGRFVVYSVPERVAVD